MDFAKLIFLLEDKLAQRKAKQKTDELDELCPPPWERAIPRSRRPKYREMEKGEEEYYLVEEAIETYHETLSRIRVGLRCNEPSSDELIRINEIKQTTINKLKQMHESLSNHASKGEEIKKKLNEAFRVQYLNTKLHHQGTPVSRSEVLANFDLITSLSNEQRAHRDTFFRNPYPFIKKIDFILQKYTE